ncbi:AMP-binding protein [Crenobacter sp. SG2305]|uniref:AMP-binding protein n=1 Tax=Crenobacter oryzisoli TaxID=3056844 RepID=UPI0025AB54A8|nr:AMP-binding protein [Crenobacter sp. SG2305]MDN0081910.1 AMP-binding protein [Crenobacter sp. SG2305]
MTLIPLLPDADRHAPFAFRHGKAIDRETFHAQVMTLAATLPEGQRVMNLCADRYWFAVALFAAIARGMLTVLPSSAAPEHIAMVAAEQPGLLVLGDQASCPVEGLPYFRVDALPPERPSTVADMPLIAFDQRVACMYTSGSTGTPMPHFKTFGRLRQAVLAGAGRVWAAAGASCSVVGTAPIRHMYGLEASVLLPIFGGGRMSTQIPFFPADIAASLAGMPAPRLLVITPFHLRKLLEADIALPDIAVILSATAPLSTELAAQARQQLGCPVVEIYGSTETGQIATRETDKESNWLTLPGITLEERGQEFWAVGEVYETPQMLNDTVELFSPEVFRLVDRKANIINVAGKRSSLSFLNATLTSLPGVVDGVFCVPERNGNDEVERLAAFVVAPGLERAQILAGLRQHVDAVFLPRHVVFVEALPRDGNGKLLARTLQELVVQHILQRN